MDLFWTRVLLSFIIGGIVVSGVSVLGERLGTRIGGLIGTLPHLIIIAFFFIGITQTPAVAAAAATSVPVTMGINVLFLFIFYKTARWSKKGASIVSLVIWGLMALPIVLLNFRNLPISVAIYVILLMVTYYLFEKKSDVPSKKKGKMKYTTSILALRGVLAGGVIAGAVVIAKFAGPVLGGIFSVFPALFLSTMLIYTFEHGADYAGAMGKTMSVGGSSVVAFAIACHFLYTSQGLVWGTVVAFIVALVVAVLVYPLILRMK
jgi:hypothetical protein